jgi:hypothetical protein
MKTFACGTKQLAICLIVTKCLSGCVQTFINPSPQELMKTTKKFDTWKDATFTVYSADDGASQTIAGIATQIWHMTEPGKYSAALHIFKTDKLKAAWVGSPQDIYIKTDNGIVGVRFLPYSGILFIPSLNVGIDATSIDVSLMAKKTEAVIDYKIALGHSLGKSGRDTSFLEGAAFIGLRGVFGAALFRNDTSAIAPPEIQRLASFEIDKGILRMDIDRAEGRSTGSVWIRIKDRVLLRAEESGVQVFPAAVK